MREKYVQPNVQPSVTEQMSYCVQQHDAEIKDQIFKYLLKEIWDKMVEFWHQWCNKARTASYAMLIMRC